MTRSETNVACDPATSACTFVPLDKDGDGHPPLACGGDDCDDTDPYRYPGATERCNGQDDDCDGVIDNGADAACEKTETCQSGACVCRPENLCGTSCVDKKSDKEHCGACSTTCSGAESCVGGTCTCTSPATLCGSSCTSLDDNQNCGTCGHTCPNDAFCAFGGACLCQMGGFADCGGTCIDVTSDTMNCGACGKTCMPGGVCAGGSCTCPDSSSLCGGVCIPWDNQNCGGCGIVCPTGTSCGAGFCQSLAGAGAGGMGSGSFGAGGAP